MPSPPPAPERELRYCLGPRARRMTSLAQQTPDAAKSHVFHALDWAAHYLEWHAEDDRRQGPRANR